jgi:transcriptional regulator with XRE-family HTH domain
MSTIHDPRYVLMIERLIHIRNEKNITQVDLAKALAKPQSYLSKTETLERRLDVVELIDWLSVLGSNELFFFETCLEVFNNFRTK